MEHSSEQIILRLLLCSICFIDFKKHHLKTHNGTRQLFGLHFVKTGVISIETGKFFSYIFDKRQTGDYDDFYDFDKEDVLELFEPANELILIISKLI